jgi:methionyl-tRNA formyltransferase
MKLIFMGTPDFAVATLSEIIDAGHEVVLVVSQPDKAVGRSKALKYTPVKECAIEHGIPVYQPEKIRDRESIDYLSKYEADAIVVVAFGQIIPKAILDMPRYCCVNVHASLLPRYRGAAPIQWAVLNGDKVTGVTTQRMDEGLDTGDIIMEEEVELREDETSGSLFDRLAVVGAKLCVRTLTAIEDGTAVYTKQDNSQATHTSKIHKEMGSVNWTDSARHIDCLVRGLNPWPGTYTRIDDKTLKIWTAHVISNDVLGTPGEIVIADKNLIGVQAKDGIIGITELQLEGKKRMSVESFMNGYTIQKGTFLRKG